MSRPGRVIVVGGAVMDATFRTKDIPQEGLQERHTLSSSRPAEKGCSKRLQRRDWGLRWHWLRQWPMTGSAMRSSIIYEDEGVDTSLLKLVEDAHTPFTGVWSSSLVTALLLIGRTARRCILTFATLTDWVSTSLTVMLYC